MPDFDVTVTEKVTKTYRITADDVWAAREETLQIFDSRDAVEDDKYNMYVNDVKEISNA